MSPHAMGCGSLSKATILAMRTAGVPTHVIATEAGVAPSSMYNALHAWGLTTPRGGDRRSRDWCTRFAERIGGAA